MTTLLTSDLIGRCHAGSRNKGFWEVRPDHNQQLMLAISELSESLEAHRKGHRCLLGSSSSLFSPEMPAELFAGEFLKHAKDTVEDELADAYIRLCDFIGGYGLDQAIIIEGVAHDREQRLEPMTYSANFAANLLKATAWIVAVSNADSEDDGSDYPFAELPMRGAMVAIEDICEIEGIDLAAHINAKLRYNATRPAKHGKAY